MQIVLVHGAWLGAWCWDAVARDLRAAGHDVRAPELDGHGTLDAYVDIVRGAITEPAVLVGHSMAGIVISQVAEAMPSEISRLVYVAAYLLRDSETITQVSQRVSDSLVGPNMILASDFSTIAIRPEALRDVFCGDAPEALARTLMAKARPEPAAPFNTPVRVTAERWGRVPRAYIKTSRDRAVTPALQELMLERTQCDPVASMDSSHTPFLSQPQQLARLILQ